MANFYTDNKDIKFHLNHPLMKKIVALKERNFVDKDNYDYAPFDFEDAMDNYDKVLNIVGEICGNIIGPNAADVDHDGPQVIDGRVIYAKGTQENYDALVKAGLVGMTMPRKYDGLNFSFIPFALSADMISRADAGFGNIWGLQDCAETIYEFANEEVKNIFLPLTAKGLTYAMDLTEPDAGSDLQAVQLKATWNEEQKMWLLNGVKRFITNGDADISLVLARSEEGTNDGRGLSLFVYEKKHLAVTVRRIENKMGIKGSPTCELVFKDAPAYLVGDRRLGLIKYVMSLMNGARLGIGAQSVGISDAAYREGLKYAKERVQFNKPIIEFPAVYELLSNMKAKLHASRSFLYETTRFVDMYKVYEEIQNHKERTLTSEEKEELKHYKRMADAFTPVLKMMSSEYCNQISYDSLQIHGGTGFMKDFPIERLYRDARITTIYEGTSQLQVVAAIRFVSTGVYLQAIKDYDKQMNNPELEYLRRILKDMTFDYEKTVYNVLLVNDPEYLDFHARRLVEMAGNIIMSYLLLIDTMRDNDYKNSAEIFIKHAFSENNLKFNYIKNFDIKDIAIYKVI